MTLKSSHIRSRPSEKIINRLSQYRRLLARHDMPGKDNIYSHEIARLAGVSAAQVRRDLMVTGYAGSPNRGYNIGKLSLAIGSIIDAEQPQRAAIVGAGHLGKAILNHFHQKKKNLRIVAAFDINEDCIGKEFSGCSCHGMDTIEEVVCQEKITVGIIAIPPASAQEAASRLVAGGVQGLVNFAPVSLDVPEDVYVADIDITTTIETAAYFARANY